MSALSEDDLLKHLRDMNTKISHTALKDFYIYHWESASHFIKPYGLQLADAEDVYQEAMTIFYTKARHPDFTFSSTPKTFLYGIIKNLIRSKERINHKNKFHDLENINVQGDDLEQTFLTRERNELLITKVKMLGKKCQEVLVLFYYEKLSMIEIAQQLEYANAQVAKNKKVNCLNQLRQLFQSRI